MERRVVPAAVAVERGARLERVDHEAVARARGDERGALGAGASGWGVGHLFVCFLVRRRGLRFVFGVVGVGVGGVAERVSEWREVCCLEEKVGEERVRKRWERKDMGWWGWG